MGSLKEIGVPIERRTPDPVNTGPEYYVVGQLSEAPPPDLSDLRGPMHPTRLWDLMAGPAPRSRGVTAAIPQEGATEVEVTETVMWPRSVRPMNTNDLHMVGRTALWAVPVALLGGAAFGYWLGRRRKKS